MPLNEGAVASLRAIIAHDCEAIVRLDEQLRGVMGEFEQRLPRSRGGCVLPAQHLQRDRKFL